MPCHILALNVSKKYMYINIIYKLTNKRCSLSPMVEAPYIARKLDWVNSVWPRDWPEDSDIKRPEVETFFGDQADACYKCV